MVEEKAKGRKGERAMKCDKATTAESTKARGREGGSAQEREEGQLPRSGTFARGPAAGSARRNDDRRGLFQRRQPSVSSWIRIPHSRREE